MNWQTTIDGLLLIGSWASGSMLTLIVFLWILNRYFPRDPNAEYTYVLKHKNGQRTTVLLPPSLPEAERKKVMDAAYRRLGVDPETGLDIKTP